MFCVIGLRPNIPLLKKIFSYMLIKIVSTSYGCLLYAVDLCSSTTHFRQTWVTCQGLGIGFPKLMFWFLFTLDRMSHIAYI